MIMMRFCISKVYPRRRDQVLFVVGVTVGFYLGELLNLLHLKRIKTMLIRHTVGDEVAVDRVKSLMKFTSRSSESSEDPENRRKSGPKE